MADATPSPQGGAKKRSRPPTPGSNASSVTSTTSTTSSTASAADNVVDEACVGGDKAEWKKELGRFKTTKRALYHILKPLGLHDPAKLQQYLEKRLEGEEDTMAPARIEAQARLNEKTAELDAEIQDQQQITAELLEKQITAALL